jgi:hypothetical protein
MKMAMHNSPEKGGKSLFGNLRLTQNLDAGYGRYRPIGLSRKFGPAGSRESGLRDPVQAGLAGRLCTQQTQLRGSNIWPVASFPAGAGSALARAAR